MKIYYLNLEQEQNKHKIIMVNYDRDDFSIANTINLPYTIKYLDEENINKELCKDLSKLAVLDKYYIDNFGDICETENWTLPFINDEVM